MSPKFSASVLACCYSLLRAAEIPSAHFRAMEIDARIEIGYGVAVADVDGDHKPDILLVDKKQVVWYRNPTWEKFVIAENLTPLDNVCVAATDINGDGKAEIAVGAQWNPGDTLNSGAVFYLNPPEDRTQRWTPMELMHEPTVHRMRWMRTRAGQFDLVVAPLHGRGNRAGQGDGVKILSYRKPVDLRETWKTEVISSSLHMTHNFELLPPVDQRDAAMLVAAREGIFKIVRQGSSWASFQIAGAGPGDTNYNGAGEVRSGHFAGGKPFIAAIEPMHGTQLVVYTPQESDAPGVLWHRQLLDVSLKEGHALACGDLLGIGSDQIICGWRVKNDAGKVGIKLFTASTGEPRVWTQVIVDDNLIACEDLCLADLNGDGALDIIASGRTTKNVKIYFNERHH